MLRISGIKKEKDIGSICITAYECQQRRYSYIFTHLSEPSYYKTLEIETLKTGSRLFPVGSGFCKVMQAKLTNASSTDKALGF